MWGGFIDLLQLLLLLLCRDFFSFFFWGGVLERRDGRRGVRAAMAFCVGILR